jgi:hypothetical protein
MKGGIGSISRWSFVKGPYQYNTVASRGFMGVTILIFFCPPQLPSCATDLVTFVSSDTFTPHIVLKQSYNCTPYIPTFATL